MQMTAFALFYGMEGRNKQLLSQFSKIVPINTAYLRYAVCGCCLCIKNANCYRRTRIADLKLVGGGVNDAPLGKYQNFSVNFVQPAEINKFHCKITRNALQ